MGTLQPDVDRLSSIADSPSVLRLSLQRDGQAAMTSDALRRDDSPQILFLRDDDIGPLTPELRFFVETFLERGLPVSYQIIPAQLTDTCAAFLVDCARKAPHLIEFGQHGLHHAMVVGGKTLKREFGPERTFEAQSSDIQAGLRILRERLGEDHPITVFTPPQHKYDANTVKAVTAAGHKTFSAASYPSAHHRLAYALGRLLRLSSIRHQGISYHCGPRPEADIQEISISVAVDDGRSRQIAASDLAAGVRAAARHTAVVGLMLHHAVYAGDEGQAALGAIADELARLGPANFHRLGDLAPAAAAA